MHTYVLWPVRQWVFCSFLPMRQEMHAHSSQPRAFRGHPENQGTCYIDYTTLGVISQHMGYKERQDQGVRA